MNRARPRNTDPNLGMRTCRERYSSKLSRALDLGFSERLAPLIANAAVMHPGRTVGELRRHVECQYPWLSEDDAQGRLFEDEVLV